VTIGQASHRSTRAPDTETLLPRVRRRCSWQNKDRRGVVTLRYSARDEIGERQVNLRSKRKVLSRQEYWRQANE